MSFIQEFKEFAIKGNVIDMAVGILIGTAFGKIVSSFLNDIVMPPIGYLTGGVNFSELKYTFPSLLNEMKDKTLEPVTINYGNFIQVSIDFIIIALAIFIVIKAINKLKKQEAEETIEISSEPSNQEVLLAEIRDLIKAKNL